MNHTELAERFLAEFTGRGLPASEIVDTARKEVDLAATTYFGRCMTRPVFLDQAEHAQLSTDLENLHAAVTALPDRMFGGDLAAFARAAGMNEDQVTAVMRGRGPAATRMARADLYPNGSGYRLMELNMGSTVGGGDNAMLNRAMLAHPLVAEFVEAHRLSYVDSLAEVVRTMCAETGITPGDGSLVAAVDWPPAVDEFGDVLRTSSAELATLGIELIPCHLGHLSLHDRRVWLDGRPVDVIYRVFLIEDLLHPDGPALIDPVLRAVERGEVKLFTPMDSELYGSKGALALISDEANRHLFTPGELASLDRILPWTRIVRPGPVTVAGETVDLREYALANRADLIIKPTAKHGGLGVVPGWLTEPDEWSRQFDALADGASVIQRRIRPVSELFPAEEGVEPWVLTWGAFLCERGYGGMWVRGSRDPDVGAVNMATGASATCCFHQSGTGDTAAG